MSELPNEITVAGVRYYAAQPKRRVDRPEPRQRYKSVEHQKAVALQRRMKRIRKAENLLREKRRRQGRQWERHLSRDSGYRQFKRGLLASIAATLHIPVNATIQSGDAAYSYSMERAMQNGNRNENRMV